MKLTVEQVTTETPEEVLIRCHDPEEPWVSEVQNIAAGQITVNGVLDGKMCRLKLGDIYYFEVVEGNSFLYCQKEVFSCKQKLYEFEALCIGTISDHIYRDEALSSEERQLSFTQMMEIALDTAVKMNNL